MPRIIAMAGLAAIALPGCSGSSFDSQRTVFNNPYVALETDNGPVGPACDESASREPNCRNNDRPYPVSEYVRDADGNLVRLTRSERQFFRERREALQSRSDVLESLEKGTPIPSDSPALRENQSRPAARPLPADD